MNEIGDLKENELIVTFVVSGEYEWYNKNHQNVLRGNYLKEVLTVCTALTNDLFDIPSHNDDYFTKWFTNTSGGWHVKNHEDP